MKYETAVAITMIITVVLTLWYYIKRVVKWIEKYKKPKLNNTQIQENIKYGRRYDWGVSSESNWKNTWNPNNPKEHKWIEFIILFIKTIVLMKVLIWGIIFAITFTIGIKFN